MKNFFTNTLTIISEFIVLILGLIWYYDTKQIEALITLVISIVAILTSAIKYFSAKARNQIDNIVDQSTEKILHEDFLHNYVPGETTIGKIIEDLGEPIAKITDYVELDWKNNKKFEYFVYKYKFANAVVLFTTELKDVNIISVSLISKLDKKNPIKCRYSYAEDDTYFGQALITENIIENSTEFKNQNYARWMYSSITSRYVEYSPIKYLDFTYFIYNHFDHELEMKSQEIDGICISTMSDVKPIVHFDDYNFG